MSSTRNRICPDDGSPMLRIKGRWECVVEYMKRCVGQDSIVDVVKRGKTTYYVFRSGHQVPLLCSCCGRWLPVEDVEEERRKVVGRLLLEVETTPAVFDNGREGYELALVLVDIKQSDGLAVMVSIQCAAQMIHPAECSYGKEVSARKRRKKRSK